MVKNYTIPFDQYSHQKKNWLVVLTILKNISQWEGVSMSIPYIMESKKCLKPPTRKQMTKHDQHNFAHF